MTFAGNWKKPVRYSRSVEGKAPIIRRWLTRLSTFKQLDKTFLDDL